jgi:MFS family permease
VSTLGNAISPVALAFGILEVTKSAAALGLVLACAIVPQGVFLLVGGVIADRLPRRNIMVWSNVLSALSQGAIAFLLAVDAAQLWELATLSAISGTAAAFFGPASQGVLPQVVDRSAIHGANALLRLAQNSARIVGPAIAGVIVVTAGPSAAIAIDSATFVASSYCMMRLRVPLPRRVETRFVRDLVNGWHEFWSYGWLWTIVLQYSLVNMAWACGFQTLGPVVISQAEGGAGLWGAAMSCLAAGLLLGAPIVLYWRPRRPLLAACAGTVLKTLPLLALAFSPSVFTIGIATLLAGVGTEIFVVNFSAVMQERIPEEKLSRVSSYDILFGLALTPVGNIAAGPLLDVLDTRRALLLLSAVIVVSTGLVAVRRSVIAIVRPSHQTAALNSQSTPPTPAEHRSVAGPPEGRAAEAGSPST